MIQISDQDTGFETGVHNKRFHGVLWVDASKYQTGAEDEVGEEIKKMTQVNEIPKGQVKQ